ncbi:MAG: winged helix-turn-helix transcriptional regulator [Candidatus Colwellbacteria bacterium]|nr:winged helix-turn-helix transcriptional regulator [Candidatus Colwellbacteria bacterium]MBI3089016.1 winged helix-turn-helix transcriptional regulator [Candidatus Colwellbacteria bacterium]
MQARDTRGERSRTIKQIKKELRDQKALIQCAQEFNAVGDPTRLKICYLLCCHKELSVGEIAEIIGVSISAVSHTLKKLKKAEVVEGRRDFRNVYYQLKKSPLVEMLKERLKVI